VKFFSRKGRGARRDRRDVAALPTVAALERELCALLANGKLPDDQVAAFADPAHREVIRAHLDALRGLQAALQTFHRSADDADLLAMAAGRYALCARSAELAVTLALSRRMEAGAA
jgi:hypothetical protein